MTFDDTITIITLIIVIISILLWITTLISIIINDQIRAIKIYRIISIVLFPPIGVLLPILKFLSISIKNDINSGKINKRLKRVNSVFNIFFQLLLNIFKWLFNINISKSEK